VLLWPCGDAAKGERRCYILPATLLQSPGGRCYKRAATQLQSPGDAATIARWHCCYKQLVETASTNYQCCKAGCYEQQAVVLLAASIDDARVDASSPPASALYGGR
jgi:hypothetical protein